MVSVSELFSVALDFEREGRRVYLEAARRATDPVVQAVLSSLAQDEHVHETLIRQYYQALERSEGWPQPNGEVFASIPARRRIQAIIEETAGAIGPDETFLGVYERARDLEQKSRDFYRAQADATQDRQLVKFFRFLAGTEQTHLEMLGMLVDATREAAETALRGGDKP